MTFQYNCYSSNKFICKNKLLPTAPYSTVLCRYRIILFENDFLSMSKRSIGNCHETKNEFTTTGPGMIHVLLPPNSNDVEIGKEVSLPPIIPTSSYEIGHYDLEQPIHISTTSTSSCTRTIDDDDSQTRSWNVFEGYILNGTPVKFHNISSFRRQERKNGRKRPHIKIDSGKEQETNFPLFPNDLLSTIVTVQCQTKKNQNLVDDEEKRDRLLFLEKVNQTLTVVPATTSSSNQKNVTTFYGQENQITCQMKLGDVMSFKRQHDEKNSQIHQHYQDMDICIAQETILTTSCPSGDENDTSSLLSSIQCSCDGSLSSYKSNDVSQDDAPLSSLAPYIFAPAYLLPNKHVSIKEVNFWFAPNESGTNTHYDGNHNILMVLKGRKTIELSPPHSVKGSPIYSHHANHPYIYSSSYFKQITTKTKASNSDIQQEFDEMKKHYMASTMVVSISAGEGIFIPEGWWHRVESSSSCCAINFWFQLKTQGIDALIHPSNKHMYHYHAREIMRRYFDDQIDDLSQKLLSQAREYYTNNKLQSNSFCTRTEYLSLCQSFQSNCAERRHFVISQIENLYRTAIQKMIDEESSTSSNDVICGIVSHLSILWNIFLLNMNPLKGEDRTNLLNFIHVIHKLHAEQIIMTAVRTTKPKVDTTNVIIYQVMNSLESSSCFVLTRTWEKQEVKHHEKVVDSYNAFFSLVDDSIRDQLLKKVESFKKGISMHILTNELNIV